MHAFDSTRHDQHHIDKYQAFCKIYGIEDVDLVVRLYDIYELVSFLPGHPAEEEKKALQSLIGVQGELGYMDYMRSNNTFELIMQWREQTGNFTDPPISVADALNGKV